MSKSLAHRYLICSYLAGNMDAVTEFEKEYAPLCDDLKATAGCLKALAENSGELCCKESGTTLRLLLPVVAALGREAVFRIEGSLVGRPIQELADELNRHGAVVKRQSDDKGEFISVSGKLEPGEFVLPGNVSSQYISGMLLAMPIIGGSSLRVDESIESLSYVEMTMEVMEAFGVIAGCNEYADENEFEVSQNYSYSEDCRDIIEGDWSAGAMWLAVNELLGGSLEIEGIRENSAQGDSRIAEILEIYRETESWESDGDESGDCEIEINVEDCPDLVPAIALRAVTAKATTIIVGAGRLRLKESDRLSTVASVLRQLGADVAEATDSLTIAGTGGRLLPASDKPVDCAGDHRIVMLAALASAVCEHAVTIADPEAVSKSFPAFFETIEHLGGELIKK